ncbi:MAG: hypothetical protein IT282_02385 [Bacteroidetes bacterium]|nr:hypothetical protein [Bacteroidota bacterium]
MQKTGGSTLRDLTKFSDQATLPADPGDALRRFLREEYLERGGNPLLNLYYRMKPLIPRPLQLALRRRYITRQAQRQFPNWPIEPCVVDLLRDYVLETVQLNGGEAPHSCAFWPHGKQFAFVITHDIEWDAGLRRAPALGALEKKHGFTSSWNFVPERYPIDWAILEELRAEGFELGLHGLKHDGKLFASRKIFEARVNQMKVYASKWGLAGFRSPSTLRNPEWMHVLPFEYDSTFPDTDPYEPQPGGCCTIWPYFFADLVELPMTLPQDHTLFEILGHRDIAVWQKKASWIMRHGGMVLINVHPDYMMTQERLSLYEEFLVWMRSFDGMYHALPLEVSRWWRARNASRVSLRDGRPAILGPAADKGVLVRARPGEDAVTWTPVSP